MWISGIHRFSPLLDNLLILNNVRYCYSFEIELYPYENGKNENVIFNDALNTFNIRLYGVEHMVKDHSARGGNILPSLHGYSFCLAARDFYMHHPTDRIAHTTVFVTPVVEHWLEREIAQ